MTITMLSRNGTEGKNAQDKKRTANQWTVQFSNSKHPYDIFLTCTVFKLSQIFPDEKLFACLYDVAALSGLWVKDECYWQ